MMRLPMHYFSILALSAAVLLVMPARGFAQDAPTDEPAARSDPALAPADATAGEVRALYDDAFAALLAGNLGAARRGFLEVAGRATDTEIRAASRELARLALELQERRIRLVAEAGAAPPSALPSSPPRRRPGYDEEDSTAGRTSFVISTTLASFYSGVVLVDLLDIGDDFRVSVGTVLATTAAGFLGSYVGSDGRHISEAMADSFSLGMGLGVGNALLLAWPMGLDDSSEQVQGFALGSMVLGGTAGMLLADRARPTRGQVNFASMTSVLGIATTGLGLAIIQPEDIEGDNLLLMLAGGLDLGLAAGMTFGPRIDWSLSRTRLVSLGTFLGALVSWSTVALLTGTDVDGGDNIARLWAGSTLAGMWGGFGVAAHLTRNMAPDPRFSGNAGPVRSTMITPAAIRGGMGLALSGSF